jgi:DNA-binding NtrC family response regulator
VGRVFSEGCTRRTAGGEPASASLNFATCESGMSLHELPEGMTLEQRVEQLERAIVEHTLRRHRFDKERAAQQLGMGRSTLYKRLKGWGLERGEEEPSP